MIILSLRYLLSRLRQTLLMLLGIFFRTSAYVSISGFMLGFREFMVDQLVNNNAHVHIIARQEFLEPHNLDSAFYGTQYQLCLYMQTLPFSGGRMGNLTGHIIVSLNPNIYFQAASLAILSASIASILPARAAGKLTPIEIIRAATE